MEIDLDRNGKVQGKVSVFRRNESFFVLIKNILIVFSRVVGEQFG